MKNQRKDRKTIKDKIFNSYCNSKTINIEKLKKRRILIFSGITASVLILMIVCFIVSGAFARKYGAITVCGEKITVAEYNFYYSKTIMEFVKTITVYNADYSLNFSKPLNKQQCYMTFDKTWAEYFRDRTLDQISIYYSATQEAAENNVELDENDYKRIDYEIERIKKTASNNGESVNEYLKSQYGRGVTQKVIKKAMERICLAQRYIHKCLNDMNIPDNEIVQRYNNSKKWYDVVDYRIDYTSENNIEEHANNESTTFQDVAYVDIGDYDIAEWLFDNCRSYGDKMVFKDSEGMFNTVCFIGRKKNEKPTVNGRSILITPDISLGELVPSEMQIEDAELRAQELFDDYLDNPNEEYFKDLAQIYSDDIQTYVNGGEICEFLEDSINEDIEVWFYEPVRKNGDCKLFETNRGWQILYYRGSGEPHWKAKIIKNIRDEQKKTIEGKYIEAASVKQNALWLMLVK